MKGTKTPWVRPASQSPWASSSCYRACCPARYLLRPGGPVPADQDLSSTLCSYLSLVLEGSRAQTPGAPKGRGWQGCSAQGTLSPSPGSLQRFDVGAGASHRGLALAASELSSNIFMKERPSWLFHCCHRSHVAWENCSGPLVLTFPSPWSRGEKRCAGLSSRRPCRGLGGGQGQGAALRGQESQHGCLPLTSASEELLPPA